MMQVQIGHIPPEGRRLSSLGGAALAAVALAVGLALSGAPRAAAAHAAFALGAMPLIFAAMGHFVPVLTRTGGAPSALGRLPRAMQEAIAAVGAGASHGAALAALRERLLSGGFASVDYAEIRDADSLVPLEAGDGGTPRLFVAARIGSTRLIDNMPLT